MSVDFAKYLNESIEALYKKGGFLTVKTTDCVNTMTIGWGNIGYEWGKPIFIVMVRKSRYTHELLKNTNEFTISIPLNEKLDEALKICGTKSGKVINKIEKCNLDLVTSKKIKTPIIGGCEIYYECKIVYRQDMNLDLLNKDIKEIYYNADDYHTLYYGEILNCYKL